MKALNFYPNDSFSQITKNKYNWFLPPNKQKIKWCVAVFLEIHEK